MEATLLESKWQKLFLPFQGRPDLVQKTFAQVVTAYSHKQRYYHNLLHVQHVLHIIDTLEPLARNFIAIQMAAWFHDVIYNPKSNDNEEESTKFADTSLRNLNVPPIIINQVISMILYTKKHDAPLDDIDSQILLDADLSILGSTESEYMIYAQAIRQEYAWLSDEEYRMGRKKILQRFLSQEKIYFTKLAFQMFELQARENIRKEILEWSWVNI